LLAWFCEPLSDEVALPSEERARLTQSWLEQRERGSILGIRLVVAIATLLGRTGARLVLLPACLYFLAFSVNARAASRKYLARVLERPPRLTDLFRHYFTFATVTLDRVFLLKRRYDLFDTRLHNEAVMQQMLDRGQGCLLLGAHLGSFEIMRSLGLSKRLDVGMLMFEENARTIGRVVRAIDPALSDTIIALGRFDSMLKVHERLQRHDWVGILGDRSLDPAGEVRVPFFGEPAAFPSAPFRMALMVKRPVVLMVGLYRGANRYDLHFESVFEPHGVGRREREAAIEAAVRHYAARLEHYCRLAPFNWFNFYDFWAERSPQ
jgi:predicted LPLAT superfamily acyltransferase